MKNIMLVAVSVLVLIIFSAIASADGLTCGGSIAVDTELTTDYDCTGSSGFTIDASDITLDCAGHIILGNDSNSGLYISSYSNVTIKNCNITGFSGYGGKGISLFSSNDNNLLNNSLYNNYYGIYTQSTSSTTISSSNLSANTHSGVTIDACLLAGTRILMSDLTYKSIEDVRVGDHVLSYDENTLHLKAAKVRRTFVHEATEGYLIINDELRLTSNHPMYVNGMWLEAGMIRIGDLLLDKDGSYVPVESIAYVADSVSTYNLEVAGYHNYYAQDVLTHNKCPMIFSYNGTGYEFDLLINVAQFGIENDRYFSYPLKHLVEPRIVMEHDPYEANYVDFIGLNVTDRADGHDPVNHILAPISCIADGGCNLDKIADIDGDYLMLDEGHDQYYIEFEDMPALEYGYARDIEIISSGYQERVAPVDMWSYPGYITLFLNEYFAARSHNSYTQIIYNTISENGFGFEDCGIEFIGSEYNSNITNNSIYSNYRGICISGGGSNLIWNNTLYENQNESIYLSSVDPDTTMIWHNNIYNNSPAGNQVYSNVDINLTNGTDGNYWGHSCPALFIGGVDSNMPSVNDTYPFAAADAWLLYGPNDCLGVTVDSVSLAEDMFVCGLDGHTANNAAHIRVNATDAGFSSIAWVNASMVSPALETGLSYNDTSGLWETYIIFENTSGYDFESVNITISAQDNGGNAHYLWGSIEPFASAILYSMTTPPMEGECERAGEATTIFCDVLDFEHVNFVHEIEVNGSQDCNPQTGELPWGDDFSKVITLNFSSLNFSSPDIGAKLGALGGAIMPYITPPGMFGDSYISVNTTAFAELDSNTTITLYGLPFAIEPEIVGEGNVSDIEFILNEPYALQMTCEDLCEDYGEYGFLDFGTCNDTCHSEGDWEFGMSVPNSDLTFTVSGFSQYNMTDQVPPEITFISPENGSAATGNDTYIMPVNFTVNGTGTQLSNITYILDSQDQVSLDYYDILAQCSNVTPEWDVVTCDPTSMTNMTRGIHSVMVIATDLGGEAGNAAASESEFTLDTVSCGESVSENLTLVRNITCDGDGLLFNADGVTLDCDGHAILGVYTASGRGIIDNGYHNVTIKNCSVEGFATGIYANSVLGMTIQDSDVSSNYGGVGSGIRFDYVSNSLILRSNIFGNDIGVHLYSSDNNTIEGNQIFGNNDASGPTYGYGIYIESANPNCSDNKIRGNNISGHDYYGVYLSSSCNSNEVTGNEISSNYYGIYLDDSDSNTILYNNLTGNDIGFYVWYADFNSIGNNTLNQTASSNFGSTVSCPYLYTWNGSDYEFYGDINGPGGMTIKRNMSIYGGTLQTRPPTSKDYSAIQSTYLVPYGGTYNIEIGEEQDEMTYIDEAQLWVIDHSPEVDIYSPEAALMTVTSDLYAPVIHTVRDVASPVSATDRNSEDILSVIASPDEVYTDAAPLTDNFITLDLGNLSSASQIKLIYRAYYNSSPISPIKKTVQYVEVKDAEGNWVMVSDTEHFGFPEVYPRTYVVDITDWFKTDDWHVRLHTGNNIVNVDWLGVDTSLDEDVNVTVLHPQSAQLYFKGPKNRGFEYFYGNFTKYGNVSPLLEETDDQYVIMRSGDALKIRFQQQPDTASERDFMLMTDSYYKTSMAKEKLGVNISEVTPLPFHGMSNYPYELNESYPYDEEHNGYLADWNTREYTGGMGMSMPYSYNNTVSDNTIIGTGSDIGLYLQYEEGTQILRNNISETSTALQIDNSNIITVSGNNLSNNEYGIYMYDTYGSIISQNTLDDNPYYAIYIYTEGSSSNTQIIGNTIVGNTAYDSYYAVEIHDDSNVTIINNSIKDNNYGGLYSTGSIIDLQNGDFVNNGFDAPTAYGIYDASGLSIVWTITSSSECINNTLYLVEPISGLDMLSADNCTILVDGHNVCTDIDACECGDMLSTNMTLSENVSCEGDGYLLGNDAITFDCDGYSMIGAQAGTGLTIEGYSNVTIKNCEVTNFTTNIYLKDSEGDTIQNNTVTRNPPGFYGIYADSLNSTLIEDNFIAYNARGLYMAGSYGNTIQANTFFNNSEEGIYLQDSHNNILLDNVVKNNTASGIQLSSSSSNNITGGEICYNNLADLTNAGFRADGSMDNMISGVYMHNNKKYAVLASSSDNLAIISNNIDDNCGGESGISISSSSNVILESNNVTDGTGDGIQLYSSTAYINDNKVWNNTNYGLYVSYDSTATARNGEFIGNRNGYGLYDNGPDQVDWRINSTTICTNNKLSFFGTLTFAGGTLRLKNCTLKINNTMVFEKDANITSLGTKQESVADNESKDFDFSQDVSSNITLKLADNVTVSLTVTSQTPTTKPSASVNTLKAIDIEVDNATRGNLTWALIKIYYNGSELTAADIDESTLKIYYYNETSASWQLEPNQGVDTANDYVWANVTHFSLFGAFGSAPTTTEEETETTTTSRRGSSGGAATIYALGEIGTAIKDFLLSRYTIFGFSIESKYHQIRTTQVDLVSRTATFEIQSTAINVTMSEGQTQYLDFEGDGKSDMELKLVSITSQSTVSVQIREYSGTMPPAPTLPSPVQAVTPTAPAQPAAPEEKAAVTQPPIVPAPPAEATIPEVPAMPEEAETVVQQPPAPKPKTEEGPAQAIRIRAKEAAPTKAAIYMFWIMLASALIIGAAAAVYFLRKPQMPTKGQKKG